MLRHRLRVRSRQPGYSRRVRSVAPSLPSGALRAQGPASCLAGSKQGTQASSWAAGFSCFLPSRSLGRAPRAGPWPPAPSLLLVPSPPRLLALRPTSPAPPPPPQPSRVRLSLGSRRPSLLWVPFPRVGVLPLNEQSGAGPPPPHSGVWAGVLLCSEDPHYPRWGPVGLCRCQARVVGSVKVKT